MEDFNLFVLLGFNKYKDMMKVSKNLKLLIFFPALMFCLIFFSQDAFGQKNSDIIVSDSGNCTENAVYFDTIITKANPYPEFPNSSVIILIARLGDGEKSRKYNERRLEVIKAGITASDKDSAKKVITAQGGRVSGKGVVEVYADGQLIAIFKAERKKNIASRNCKV